MHLLIFYAFILFQFAQAKLPQFNCARYWKKGATYTVDGKCVHVNIGGAKQPLHQGHYSYEIITLAELEDNQSWLVDIGGRINQAVSDTIWQYETLGGRLSNLVFIITNILDAEKPWAKADTWRPSGTQGPCQIRLYNEFNIATPAIQKQAIAHEIFHCVTMTMNPPQGGSGGSLWWIEGTAQYFMNWVYPTGNYEWERNGMFDPDRSFLEQQGTFKDYTFEHYFQSLEMRKGPSGILRWAMAQAFSSTPQLERTRLSSMADFADDFHHWAKQYSAGHIKDTDTTFPQLKPITTLEAKLSGDKSANVVFYTFQLKQFKLDVKPGRTIKLSLQSTDKNVRASYKDNGVWVEMATSSGQGSTGVLELPCNNKQLIPILILLTSTDDKEEAKAEIIVEEVKKNKSCDCQPKRKKKRFLLGMPGLAIRSPQEELFIDPFDESTPPVDDTGEEKCEAPEAPEEGPKGNGTCEDSPLPIDPCLTGKKWTLDMATTQRLIRDGIAASAGDVLKINSVSVTGTGEMNLDKKTTYAYKDYTIDMSVTAADQTLQVKTVINGKGEAVLNMLNGGNGKGAFCLRVVWGEGKAVGSNPLVGDIVFDFGKNFIEQRMAIQYECSANSLSMSGMLDGVQWGPYGYAA